MDADTIGGAQTAAEPEQPRPVVPILLASENPADKMKEITGRLEQGIQNVFESDRYKEYLNTLSKFHTYSFNNTMLIAMQGGHFVKGFRQWENEFDRHVRKGEKGINMQELAAGVIGKLEAMTDAAFSEAQFAFTDDE